MSQEISKAAASYCDLAKLMSEEYRARRTLEWQMHLALWTLLAGVAYLGVIKDVHLGGVVVFVMVAVLLHIIWTIKIVRGQIREQNLSRYYRACAVALLRGANAADLPPPPTDEEGGSPPSWLNKLDKRLAGFHWWFAVHLGTTLLLSAVVIWLWLKKPEQTPEPTAGAVTAPAMHRP